MLNKSRQANSERGLGDFPTAELGKMGQRMGDSRPRSLLTVNQQTADMIGHSRPNFVYQTSNDVVERRMILLNYCLSDIERFHEDIGRNQDFHSPPPPQMSDLRATDFIGIFQKIKLAINLLVREEKCTEWFTDRCKNFLLTGLSRE